MPVDKFGRSDKSMVVTKGVSLRCISNNCLRRGGTNTATGSINMTGNTQWRIQELVSRVVSKSRKFKWLVKVGACKDVNPLI